MKALILATETGSSTELGDRCPLVLTILVDRPFAQHITEYLASFGVQEIHWVVSRHAAQIERFLGDGSRWGMKFVYHVASGSRDAYWYARAALPNEASRELVLLGHADRLPKLSKEHVTSSRPRLIGGPASSGDSSPEWSGWAVVQWSDFRRLPVGADEQELLAHLKDNLESEYEWVHADTVLSVQSGAAILNAHEAAIQGKFPGLVLSGREIRPGIRIGRQVRLAADVELKAPVYIGENSRIGSGAVLGPSVFVGDHSLLDDGCRARRTVVLPRTYFGRGVDACNALIGDGVLVPAGAVSLQIPSGSGIACLCPTAVLNGMRRVIGRLTGLLIFAAASPVILLVAGWLRLTRRGPVLFRRTAALHSPRQRGGEQQTFELFSFTDEIMDNGVASIAPTFRDMFLRVLPALMNVARGELAVVGLPIRTCEEVSELPDDWRALYLRSKIGIVTETSARFDEPPAERIQEIIERCYSAQNSRARDVATLARFLGRLVGVRRAEKSVKAVQCEMISGGQRPGQVSVLSPLALTAAK
jgi:NDP-sugar pyrophosphorylase family protein